ncbi:NUDIX domain-containing protein [Actinomadura sp. NBRC 104425]|uniref:NUDIX domain-containing protein n=1 Tax=Actinomadura sp. NBRC 104425 TaxID=3032204 RepID=UPI00255379AA|nr:NUDIX domain-containing protein [Actinomadura sp. NBRC 104425]
MSVTGIVLRGDGNILAIKRMDDGRWVPPGGVLELDEHPHDGVIREVLEETGVRIEVERLTGVYKNMKLGVVSLAFLCRPVGGQAGPSTEASKVEWVLPTEVASMMPEARAIRVLDALSDGGPYVRIHDGSVLL